ANVNAGGVGTVAGVGASTATVNTAIAGDATVAAEARSIAATTATIAGVSVVGASGSAVLTSTASLAGSSVVSFIYPIGTRRNAFIPNTANSARWVNTRNRFGT
ncbi:MAG TPA: hypothetical protein VIG24_06470, partial [Acidimicrobiia bacterium]